MDMLADNEIVVFAHAVKYTSVSYCHSYIILTQGGIRRRVYNGYYFDDNGRYIYISTICSNMFAHKKRAKKFIVDTLTKRWRHYGEATECIVTEHFPEHIAPIKNNDIEYLKR